MKAELAPKHSQKIGNNYVLWFESSNSYIVISVAAYQLLSLYLDAKNENAFIKSVGSSNTVTPEDAITYTNELSLFLKTVNKKQPKDTTIKSVVVIPATKITKNYKFGVTNLTIHYASTRLLQLIHPHFEHSSVETTLDNATIIDIFEDQKLLYLFKNNSFVRSYDIKDSHFLQGKLSMLLITAIYDTTEADWMATFHASTVCNELEAIMIIGESGHGKSTLSAVLMAHGWDLLADDFTPMLANNQHLYRFPAAISIKKGAFDVMRSLFKGFETLTPQKSSSKPISVKFLPPSQSFSSSKKHFECHKIVKVKYSPDVTSELKVCEAEDILPSFIPDSWISPHPEHSKKFLNWLEQLKFYELNYGSNEIAITKFKELFEL